MEVSNDCINAIKRFEGF
jgi:lysozyme